MNEKHGVTGVIFAEKNNERFFLVLHRVLNWSGWEFVKGGMDEGETPLQAVLREIKEEAGLSKVSVVSMLPEKFSWTSNNTKYVYVPFILRADLDEPVSLVQEVVEHDAYKWLPEKEVEFYLTHIDNKNIFHEALRILK